MAHLRVEVDIGEELLRHTLQGVLWPLREPVNGRAIDQRGEVPDSISQRITDRTEAHHNVKILPASLDEVSKELLGSSLWATVFVLGGGSHGVLNVILLIRWEDVWDFSRVEDVVDVFKEAFLLDTVIGEDESCGVSLASHLLEHDLQVLSELDLRVDFLDLDLENFEVSHLGGETSQ